MAVLTEKDLEQKRERAESLREQIAAAEAKQAVTVQEQSMEIEGKNLDAEIARLEVTLAAAKEAAKVGTVREGAAGPIEAAKAAAEAASSTTPLGVTVEDPKAEQANETTGGN